MTLILKMITDQWLSKNKNPTWLWLSDSPSPWLWTTVWIVNEMNKSTWN